MLLQGGLKPGAVSLVEGRKRLPERLHSFQLIRMVRPRQGQGGSMQSRQSVFQ
jgi:hypothetical protein